MKELYRTDKVIFSGDAETGATMVSCLDCEKVLVVITQNTQFFMSKPWFCCGKERTKTSTLITF